MNIDLDSWEAGYAHGQQGGPPRCAIDSDQVSYLSVAHYLLRIPPKLPIKAGIVVCVHAAFENFGVTGPIKEPRRDTQRANLIAGCPRATNLIALANYVVGSDMACVLARLMKFEGVSNLIGSC